MRIIILVLFLLLNGFLFGQNLRSGGPLKPEQANMDIRHYRVALNVDPKMQTIDGYAETDLILEKEADVLLFDLTNVLSIKKVTVNGKQNQFRHDSNLVYITNKNPWPKGRIKVKIEYGGKPAIAVSPPWIGGFQWANDSLGRPWISVTCQGEGAKIYFPCKDHPSDEPNEGAELILTVPKGLTATGPGLLKKVSHKAGLSTFYWKTNYTINNYCIVFNVGSYLPVTRNYTTVAGNKVPMVFYVLDYHKDKAPYHLQLLERSSKILEKYFGEYPWVKEKIGLVETPHLGMEHQTLNAYGNKFRYTKVGGEDFDWLMHHEFGHEWWANKVSNVDWAHMWIQEGICSFADALYYREMEGEESYQQRMRNTARRLSGKPVVYAEVADSDLAYSGDIYGKGSYFMHSLRYLLGDSIFFPTLKILATDPKYTYHNMVSTNDVEALFSNASGTNLKPFFHFYLYTTNKFEVVVKRTEEEKYHISLANYSEALPMEITTHEGIKKIRIDKNGVEISSRSLPVVDAKGFYLKRVIYE